MQTNTQHHEVSHPISLHQPTEMSVVVRAKPNLNHLEQMTAEWSELTRPCTTSRGQLLKVRELLIVCEALTPSEKCIVRSLQITFPFVRPIWLSNTVTEDTAILVGISHSTCPWIFAGSTNASPLKILVTDLFDQAVQKNAHLIFDAESGSNHCLIRGEVGRNVSALHPQGQIIPLFSKYTRQIVGAPRATTPELLKPQFLKNLSKLFYLLSGLTLLSGVFTFSFELNRFSIALNFLVLGIVIHLLNERSHSTKSTEPSNYLILNDEL